MLNLILFKVSVVSDVEEAEGREGADTPSTTQLNDMMHKAMYTVNHILYNLEKDKGEKF